LRPAIKAFEAFINVGCSGCHIMDQITGNAALIDTDATDAEAICEADTRPNMRFVATKTLEQ
jgi:transposase